MVVAGASIRKQIAMTALTKWIRPPKASEDRELITRYRIKFEDVMF